MPLILDSHLVCHRSRRLEKESKGRHDNLDQKRRIQDLSRFRREEDKACAVEHVFKCVVDDDDDEVVHAVYVCDARM